MLQESNKALSLYMNKILLKIIDNQELVDVLNIDDLAPPASSPSKKAEETLVKQKDTRCKGNGLNCKDASRPRRSTVSSWISTPKQACTSEFAEGTTNGHSSGWSRALKRMTIGSWSSHSHGVPVKNHHDDVKDGSRHSGGGGISSSDSDMFDRDSGIASC